MDRNPDMEGPPGKRIKVQPSVKLELEKKQSSDDFKCHNIIDEKLTISTEGLRFPTIDNMLVLNENTEAKPDGWFMYILCWIKGKRSLILLEGKVSDFKSKHMDMISALTNSGLYAEGDIDYIISGEMLVDSQRNKCLFNDDSGTFAMTYPEQFANLKKKQVFFKFKVPTERLPGNSYIIESKTPLQVSSEYTIDYPDNKNIRVKIQENKGENLYKAKIIPVYFKTPERIKSENTPSGFDVRGYTPVDKTIWQDSLSLFIEPFISSILVGYSIEFDERLGGFDVSRDMPENELVSGYCRRFCRDGLTIKTYKNENDCEHLENTTGNLCEREECRKQ